MVVLTSISYAHTLYSNSASAVSAAGVPVLLDLSDPLLLFARIQRAAADARGIGERVVSRHLLDRLNGWVSGLPGHGLI